MTTKPSGEPPAGGLNEVRPRRPEQYLFFAQAPALMTVVSMKSGLEGRNNGAAARGTSRKKAGLNEVRPRRPEQSLTAPRRVPVIEESQ